MAHLSFEEQKKLRDGAKVPWRVRLHLFFCRSCREELKSADWDLCSEFHDHYVENERQLRQSDGNSRQ